MSGTRNLLADLRRNQWAPIAAACVAGVSSGLLLLLTKPGSAADIVVPILCVVSLAVAAIARSWLWAGFIVLCLVGIHSRLY